MCKWLKAVLMSINWSLKRYDSTKVFIYGSSLELIHARAYAVCTYMYTCTYTCTYSLCNLIQIVLFGADFQGSVPVFWRLLSGPQGMTISERGGLVQWRRAVGGYINYTIRALVRNNDGSNDVMWTVTVNASRASQLLHCLVNWCILVVATSFVLNQFVKYCRRNDPNGRSVSKKAVKLPLLYPRAQCPGLEWSHCTCVSCCYICTR